MSELVDRKRSISTQLKQMNLSIRQQQSHKVFFISIIFMLILLGFNLIYGEKSNNSTFNTQAYKQPSMPELNGVIPVEGLALSTLRNYLKENPNGLVVALPDEAGFVTLNSEADYYEVIQFLNNR